MWGSGRIKHIRGSEIIREETEVLFKGKVEKMTLRLQPAFPVEGEMCLNSHVTYAELVAIVLKSTVVWGMTPCSQVVH
jgi:hypothetical protein